MLYRFTTTNRVTLIVTLKERMMIYSYADVLQNQQAAFLKEKLTCYRRLSSYFIFLTNLVFFPLSPDLYAECIALHCHSSSVHSQGFCLTRKHPKCISFIVGKLHEFVQHSRKIFILPMFISTISCILWLGWSNSLWTVGHV